MNEERTSLRLTVVKAFHKNVLCWQMKYSSRVQNVVRPLLGAVSVLSLFSSDDKDLTFYATRTTCDTRNKTRHLTSQTVHE
jgi:hypothetical protein